MKLKLNTNHLFWYTLLTAVCVLLLPQKLEADTHYYTDIMVVGSDDSDCYQRSGWKHIDQDLNDGAGGDYIYLLYKDDNSLTPTNQITDFCLKSYDSWGDVLDEFTDDKGVRWTLAPYDGGSHFKSSKGDLNSNAGGASIYLYYTKQAFADERILTNVWFNDDASGSVNGMDLNWKAGGDYIYMHTKHVSDDDGIFSDASSAFTWNTSGRGSIHLKLMTSSYSPYRTFHNATFSLKDEKGNKIPIFYLNEINSDSGNDYVKAEFKNVIPKETTLFLTNSTQYSPKYCLITSNDDQQLDYYREDGKGRASGNGYAELEWFWPARFAGKSYVLCVDGQLYYNDSGTTGYRDYSREIGSITFDDVTWQTFDPVPGTEIGEEGMVKIPCVSDHPIDWISVSYYDGYRQRKTIPSRKVENGSYAGFVLLPATEPHDSVVISGRIVTASWDKDKLGDPTWPTSNKNTLTLVLDSVPMMHNPRRLTATVDSIGSVVLNWKVSKPKYADLMDSDQFLVERSLTGKLDDFTSIGSVMLDSETEEYTFKDSLLISSLTPEMIDSVLGVPLVRYRVARAATLQLWGKNKNPTISYVQPQLATLSLMQPTNASADWSNREESKILVKWDYLKNDKSHTYVWDNRAEMRLEIEMSNRDKEIVGKETQVLTADQIAARQLEVTLHHSCVFYKITMVTESKNSPIGQGTGGVLLNIASKADYDTFRNRVANGETQLNAILTADISAGTDVLSTDSKKPFAGNFNGNGHQLNFNFSSYSQNYLAPFVHVGNGFVVANLTTTGQLKSDNKYVAGLVSHTTDGVASIENCTSGITITAGGTGDATHGGVVALHSAPGLYISNTLFNGSINLGNRTYSGGFVGWRDSTVMAYLSNSYYAGGTTTASNCVTFVRHRNNLLTFLDSCSYKNAFGDAQGFQSATAPDNECWKDGKPAIQQIEFSTPVTGNTIDVQVPDSAFYYENNGKLIKSSLSAQQQLSSVILEWATDGGAIDYFIVKRRDKAKGADAWETIANQLTENRYEDKTTAPLHTYEYCVLAANDCQGVTYQSTDTIPGLCAPTGTVRGYVRFPDGSGIPGIDVIISSSDGSVEESAKTDESGYFHKEGLPYGDFAGAYHLAPNLSGYSEVRDITFGTEPGTNLINNIEFYVDENVKFSGFVLYNGTSIPVHDVSFFVDGREVRTAAGPVTTDFEGKFSFRMLPGDHIIQVKKDGHTFYQGGYYYEGNDTTQKTHSFIVDKAGVYFYDDTRIKLIGRVAGGKEQEALPLDNSLGRNNLGDNLQMVFTLEGDRASRLVWDIQDVNLKERDEIFHHPTHDEGDYFTQVHTSLYRMVVKPDVRTGEYEVMLPPVKWKIEQITAQGYATLFQDGHTSDVIDLSDSLTLHTDIIHGQWRSKNGEDITEVQVQYHAQYSRIYHSPVNISYKQINYDTFDYLGNRYYVAKNLDGTSAKVELVRPVRKEGWPVGHSDSLRADYTFGYPVFNIERTYPVKISATERYYYNNNEKSDTVDVVRLSGGKVTIQNGFVSSTDFEKVELDSVGEYLYQLRATQIPYMTTVEEALRTLTMTLDMDGVYYEAKPLRAYILNIMPLSEANDMLSVKVPVLVDILRDPPGSSSSATLSRNSTLSSAFMLDVSANTGIDFHLGIGTSFDTWVGIGAGTYNKADNTFNVDFDLTWDINSQAAYSYTMTANTDISTSSDKYMVGADGDVYMGMNTNVLMKPAVAIRAIPDSIYQQMRGEEAAGRLFVINKGIDSQTGDPLYLVRSKTLAIGQEVESTFAHSQHYIINQLMPELVRQCQSLMFTGTKEEAQRQANATGQKVYLSLRQPDDEAFGMLNTKKKVTLGDDSWEYVYNDSIFEAQEGINYVIIKPNNTLPSDKQDLVADYCQALLAWAQMIANNEAEKLKASNLMRNFDIDGATGLSYSEQFESKYTVSNSQVDITTNFKYGEAWGAELSISEGALSVISGPLKKIFTSLLQDILEGTKAGQRNNNTRGCITVLGFNWDFYLVPVLDFDMKPTYSGEETYTRTESFNIAMDPRSHLNVDVFYADGISSEDKEVDWNNVFVNNNFNLTDTKVLDHIFNTNSSLSDKNIKHKRGFIYRTRSGATQRTWEDERVTLFYQPGTVLDARTKKIENPVIKLDKQSISGVPYGEPARFKVYMTNDSEQPEAVFPPFFDLFFQDKNNQNGAKVLMDGLSLTKSNRVIEVHPGEVTTKTIEVYAGDGFDYENLTLCLMSQEDLNIFYEATFSVHFQQTAGNVNISSPGDKWIMNTDAPYDEKYGWYLPVIISGFDRNQKNFDHIEFQYKESARGDDYWTNLCAFYADSTYFQSASGTKEMIPANGNITTKFFGEGVVMEKGYDLRAVLFCRNGNSYLTNASKVLAGVKDTRRPQLFGLPEPKDGILGAEDDIIFNFSEPIEHNYLQATTNFEVKGETNETVLQENTALLFDGEGSAESDARRNFSDKDITVEVMIKPNTTGQPMPIFSHGRDGKQLQLWLTENNQLRAVVDSKTIDGKSQLSFDDFKRVAMVLNNEQHTLSLYADELEAELDSVTYTGVGPLIFGATNQVDVTKRTFYSGRMLQGRIWNRAMDLVQLNMYGNKLLTGYEKGLIDYYPMNEGSGDYAEDGAQGAHLRLDKVGWTVPRSMSLQLDNTREQADGMKGLQLKNDFFSRDADQDYTLMFWFKTDENGRGALLSNGSGRATDVAPADKFFIGFESDSLKYRANGEEYFLGDEYSDDKWHHFALTMNKAGQVANIYLDFKPKTSFSTEKIGGMGGNLFYLGNMVWNEQGPDDDKRYQQNATTGQIDGLTLFEQALPPVLIQRYGNKGLSGEEKGLVTYLDFCRQERQKSGELLLVPYALNKVIHRDADGNISERNDTVFVVDADQILTYIDQDNGAPIQAFEELRELNFSFVGSAHQLMVNVDELNSRINKRRIYVTVSDVPDMNGNIMASPATVALFVDRNPLRWSRRQLTIDKLAAGQEHQFTVNIVNNSGANHTYTIEDLPKWLTVNTQTDVIGPKEEVELTFTINKDVNVGSYDHIIYLVDEDGLYEPLPLDIQIEGVQPGWKVSDNMKQFSMNIVGRIQIKDEIVTDSRDIVGIFDASGRCMGVNNVDFNATTAESLVYLTAYDSTMTQQPLEFRLWHYETGKIMILTPSEPINFSPNTMVGTAKNPVVLSAGDQYIQQLGLVKGWNWIAFNVYNNDFRKGKDLLNRWQWSDGDMIVDDNNNLVLRYESGQWISNKGGEGLDNFSLSVSQSYRFKSNKPMILDIPGDILRLPTFREMTVKQGWNNIGYTPMINLPIATALSDYFDEAEDGDVIKSRTEFAMFTVSDDGSKEWKGSLQYMKPGEGYMLYRKNQETTTFTYAFYEPDASIIEVSGASRMASVDAAEYARTMSLTALIKGIDVEAGDRLLVVNGAEIVGETDAAADAPVYLSIAGDKSMPLSFVIEREGEMIATANSVIDYETDAIVGTPDEPTVINFAKMDTLPQEGYYTLQGVKLPGKPQKSGVYIINGKKQVIR
jgi:hypothetical protein